MVDDKPDFLKTSLRKTNSSNTAQTQVMRTNGKSEMNGDLQHTTGNHGDKSPPVSGLAHLLQKDAGVSFRSPPSPNRNHVSSKQSSSDEHPTSTSRNAHSDGANENISISVSTSSSSSSPNQREMDKKLKDFKITQNDQNGEEYTPAVSPVLSRNASKFGTRLQSAEVRGGNSLARLLEKDAGLYRKPKQKPAVNEEVNSLLIKTKGSEIGAKRNEEVNSLLIKTKGSEIATKQNEEVNSLLIKTKSSEIAAKQNDSSSKNVSEDENKNIIIENKTPPGRMQIPKLRHVELGQGHFQQKTEQKEKGDAIEKMVPRHSNSIQNGELTTEKEVNDVVPIISIDQDIKSDKNGEEKLKSVEKICSDNDSSDVFTSDEEEARERTLRKLNTGHFPPPERSLKANMLKELSGMRSTITKLNGISPDDKDETDSTVKENGEISVNKIKMKVKTRPSLNSMVKRPTHRELTDKQKFILTHDISGMNDEQLKNEIVRLRDNLKENIKYYEDSLDEYKIQVELLKKQSGKPYHARNYKSADSYTSSTMSPQDTPVNSSVDSSPSSSRCSSVSRGSFSVPAVPPAFTKTLYAKPTKPEITPECDMKKLFWERIILPSEKETNTVWKTVQEPQLSRDEFTRLFRKKVHVQGFKRTKSLRDDKYFEKAKGKKVTKILEDDRSRTIGIMMGSLTCQMDDIKNAIYKLDHSVLEFDGLQQLYNIRPTHREIQKLQNFVKDNPKVPLDKPEEFLFQLSKMQHLDERLACLLLQDRFPHDIYSIDQRLTSIQDACKILKLNSGVPVLLSIILSFGNFMNGGTQRGQADGFQLDILLKLKDVKSQEKDMNLLQYLVKTYMKVHDAPRKDSSYTLPEPSSMLQAGQVSVKELKNDLSKAEAEVKHCEEMVKKVISECTQQTKQPFESHMTNYLKSCRKDLESHSSKLSKTLDEFKETVQYFYYTGEGDHTVSPSSFFTLWGNFLDDFKKIWKDQQSKESHPHRPPPVDMNQLRVTATIFKQRRESQENADDPNEMKKRFNTTL